MKLAIAAMLMMVAMIMLTYLNFWQTKNIDQTKIISVDLLKFLVWYGLIIFFLVNPTIILSFRYCFSVSGKLMMPQIIYMATTVISPLIISWLIFSETPTKGVIAGTIFAIISVFCVIFWK